MWGGFVGPIMSYIVGIAVTYFLLKKGSAKMPDKWTWKSILYELTFCNVMEMQEQFSVDVVCYTSTCWACVLWQLIPYLLLICFINLARSDNQECQSFFGNYADFVSWPFQVLGILCVACAAFLFLVALATPKANEDFDLTVHGEFHKMELTPAIDSETRDKDDEEKPLDKMESVDLSNQKEAAPLESALEPTPRCTVHRLKHTEEKAVIAFF
jgi:hypothetical protein